MLKSTLVFTFVLTFFSKQFGMNHDPIPTDCTKKKDLLTGKVIYTNFDIPADNEGGPAKLYRAFWKVRLDSIPNGASTRFMVSFLVDVDGRISRERVVKDEVGKVGEQILEIIKSFKWTPAICNGKKVATIRTISTQICLL